MTAAVRHKRTVSITLDPDLLQQARAAKINLSETLALAIKEQLREAAVQQWQHENAAAMAYLDQLTEEHGLLSEHYRMF